VAFLQTNETNVLDFVELPNWPLTSPDLNPVDYSVGGGALQQLVYCQKIEDIDPEQLHGHDQSRANRWCY